MDILVENLEYVYNPGTQLEVRALTDVSFSLPRGLVLGILGGTGSGKTTLMKNLNGLLSPTNGRVLADGKDIRSLGAGLRRKVGLVFQRPERQLFEETVFKDITFVLRRFSGLTEAEILSKAEAACKLAGLDLKEVGERSPLTLSDGQKRKAAIAGVLVNEPEVLMLDEPAVGLDPPGLADLTAMVEQLNGNHGRSVIIVSHDMEPFLGILDFMLVLNKGKIAAFGSPGEVCETLAGDGGMRPLLPPLALLVHDMRGAGFPMAKNGYAIPDLAAELARLTATGGVAR